MQRCVLFAGQGAQAVGMGKDLAETDPACRSLFERADQVLGIPISRICFEGPADALTRSNNCQPAIFVVSTACHQALARAKGGELFAATAGLSLGEWSALHMAGVLGFEDTLRVLEARGRFMQEACEQNPGGMVSVIGLAPEKIADVCKSAGVEVANLNSDDQTVLSGPKENIATAERLAREAGAKKTVVLNVAGAFHSSLMASAAAQLESFLSTVTFHTPRIPVVSNVTGRPHGGPDEIRKTMVRQVTSSVHWVSSVRWLVGEKGIGEFVECGPGKVLSGLTKRIDTHVAVHNIQDVGTLKKTLESLSA